MNSEMKKYPYIGKSSYSDNVVLFKSRSFGVSINSGRCTYIDEWDEGAFKNITHEHLSNTWGIVESKEHAEFIVKLAELHGFVVGIDPVNAMCFEFSVDSVNFYGIPSEVFAHNEESKQITIPLPPKSEVSADKLTPEEEFEFRQSQAVQAINSEQAYSKWVVDSGCYNLNYRSELIDTKTWPNLGDLVTVYGQQGDVILPADKNGFYIINADGLYLAAKAADITKPKSKEDLLIEELQAKLCENNYVDNYTLANDIVNGMIEGLVYEPK